MGIQRRMPRRAGRDRAHPMHDAMDTIELPETRLLHSLLRLHGRNPDGFSATLLAGGTISIVGPHGAAFYPGDACTSRFLRHLQMGFFDPSLADRSTIA